MFNCCEIIFELFQDYPSLYHLKKMMQENNVVPILAIGKRAITVYEVSSTVLFIVYLKFKYTHNEK